MHGLLTREPRVLSLLQKTEKAARSRVSVLLTGESGTGKSTLARFIHERSPRSAAPFVEVSCANLPGELLESELFGHERGAFTGAHEVHAGRFEQAHGGTMYLDEIQELEPALQGKILRAIEDGRFERLGGTGTLSADVRIVASTRETPERLLAEGRLREDLYYRMDVVRVHLPPLRERPLDIDLLAEHFLAQAVARHGLPHRRIAPDVLEVLRRYDWPGNLREMSHAIESAAVLAAEEEIRVGDLPAGLSMASPSMIRSAAAAGLPLQDVERAYIQEVLQRTGGNKSEAARILGIHRKTLHEKLRAVEAEIVRER